MKKLVLFFCAIVLILGTVETVNALCISYKGFQVSARISVGSFSIDPVDDVYIYSDTSGIDSTYSSYISDWEGDIGTWDYEYTTLDHNGNDLGMTAVHFWLDSGDGISPGEFADFQFKALEEDSENWTVDYHDSSTDLWMTEEDCKDCPEPASIILFAFGFACFAGFRKKTA